MPAAQTKGVNFVNARTFVELRANGAEGWAKVCASMSSGDRQTLESVIAIGWYSLAMYARLIRTIDGVLGTGDLAMVTRLGRFEAERDLKTLHRIFLRLASPTFLLDQTASYWGRFHDSGVWKIEKTGTRAAVGHLDGWGCVDEALCRELLAYLTRAFELTGGRSVIMSHPVCRARAGRRCTFTLQWT
jgi:hypothetical protein